MMKKLTVTLAILAFLWELNCLAASNALNPTGLVFEDTNSNGLLDTGEKPLPGVVVSDGEAVTATDSNGSYRIRTQIGRIVFVSVPGAHHAPENKFYRHTESLGKEKDKIDFPLALNDDTVDNKEFTFVFVTDTHAAAIRSAPEGIRKAYGEVEKLNPAFVIHGGDVILDALKASDEDKVVAQYELYMRQLAPIIKQPFYHTVGNHDVFGWIGLPNPARPTKLYGKRAYEKYLGPTYYSFNYKHCHFVVLDSIGRTKDPVDGSTYYGVVDKAQLDWLRKDLSQITASTPVILVTHIPTVNALGSVYGLKGDVVSTPSGEKAPKHQIANFPELFGEVLKGYNFKLALAGHYHTYEAIHWKTNQADALLVVGGSVCGEWWKGDRTIGPASWPEGFTVIQVDGEQFKPNYVAYGWKGTEEQ